MVTHIERQPYFTLLHTTELRPGVADLSNAEVSELMTIAIGKAVALVNEDISKNDEGAEIVSHSTVRLDRWLVTTFVMRHPPS